MRFHVKFNFEQENYLSYHSRFQQPQVMIMITDQELVIQPQSDMNMVTQPHLLHHPEGLK